MQHLVACFAILNALDTCHLANYNVVYGLAGSMRKTTILLKEYVQLEFHE